MTNSLQKFAHRSFYVFALTAFFAGCSSDPQKEYAQGENAFASGDYKKAIEHFEEAKDDEKVGINANFMLARSYLAIGDIKKAQEAIEKVASTNATDPDVIEVLAQIAFYNKDYQKAYDLYYGLATNDDLDAQIRAIGWSGCGVINFIKVGESPNDIKYRHLARVCFCKAIALDTKNSSARYHLALLYRDTFQYIAAAKTQLALFDAINKTLNTPRVLKVRNEMLPNIKEEVNRQIAPKGKVSYRQNPQCAAYLRKGDEFLAKKDYKNARINYEAALKLDPQNYNAVYGKALALENMGASMREQALKAYIEACRLRPEMAKPFRDAAKMAIGIGKMSQATELISRALALHSDNKNMVEFLVSCLSKSGDKATAQIYSEYLSFLRSNKR